MSKQTIAIGSDYSGVDLFDYLLPIVQTFDADVLNLNQDKTGKTPYYQTAAEMGALIAQGKADVGILICGTGMGMSIAANKFDGVRASVCESVESARLCRAINNANVLCLGAKILSPDLAEKMLRTFLETPFLDGFDAERSAWLAKGVAALQDVEKEAHALT